MIARRHGPLAGGNGRAPNFAVRLPENGHHLRPKLEDFNLKGLEDVLRPLDMRGLPGELRIFGELKALKRDPILRGEINGKQIPKLHGISVLVVPGVFANSGAFKIMEDWLELIGCNVGKVNIKGANILHPDTVYIQLLRAARKLRKETGEKVVVMGHSIGGMEANLLAKRHPEIVDTIITFATPYTYPIEITPPVLAAIGLMAGLEYGQEDIRRFIKESTSPTGVRTVSIYSTEDGAMNYKNCILPEGRGVNVNSGGGTHLGMGVNPRIYYLLAGILSRLDEMRNGG